MRRGFTTGSCAAAAAGAAIRMLITGQDIENIDIITPKKEVFHADIVDIARSRDRVVCAVIKDGGDDPDVTTGAHITVEACFGKEGDQRVTILGGPGVGRVTKPGLDQPVGEAAINSVPRRMITETVLDALQRADIYREVIITVSVPTGEEVAKKTFNPRLGIEGGISIIGTSGVVEPMSTKALIDTIHVELSQHRALGREIAVAAPGNYGTKFLKDTYGYDVDGSVKCSNFIGDTIDYACQLGFKGFILIGHIGKLIKIAGGIMNTHSRDADSRMEIMSAIAIEQGISLEGAKKILKCFTTEEALMIIKDAGILQQVCDRIIERILFYLDKRARGSLRLECVLFASDEGLLACSKGAKEWLTLLGQGAEVQI